jgi:tetratricopeptide (TPR) repeat protein
MPSRANLVLGAVFAAAMLSSASPSPAQTLQDRHCTGKPDVADDQQIAGCSDAIKSGSFAGKDLAAALSNRGRAYYNKNDFDRAMADFDQAIATDPGTALLFYRRSALYFFRKDYDRAIDDSTRALALDPDYVLA